MKLRSCNSYYVYIVTDEAKQELTISITCDLSGRIAQLENIWKKMPDGIGKTIYCKNLIWWQHFTNEAQAVAKQQQITTFPFQMKKQLIEQLNPQCRFLNEEWKPEN